MAAVFLVVGVGLLYYGADRLVRGASALALGVGLSPLVVGLTVVAFGTSAPELVVSTGAALRGQGDIALGNVVGSNVANIALILGVASLARPMSVHLQVIRVDIPVMIAVSLGLVALLLDGRLGRFDGTLLFVGIVLYTGVTIFMARREANSPGAAEFREELAPAGMGTLRASGVAVLGLGLLLIGARLFVDGAVSLATALGVSEVVIGLTVVAVGTSLPELATSFVAALKGEADIAVGNVVGSNVFNILGILGVCGFLSPLAVEGVRLADLAVMVGTAVVLLPLARSGAEISRLEGGLLLAGYASYVAWLVAR